VRKIEKGREKKTWEEGGNEKDRLTKETRADNVRVMVASGYFYILSVPLKANVRDNASFPCTDRLHHPLTHCASS